MHALVFIGSAAAALIGLAYYQQLPPSPRSDSLPPLGTTGSVMTWVTQDNIQDSICRSGFTFVFRPAEEYTHYLKTQQLGVDATLSDYEEDHLVPLTLAGHPTDPNNLWPQPRHARDGWTAKLKDDLEVRLNHLVCDGKVKLADAQYAISKDWHAAWYRYGR